MTPFDHLPTSNPITVIADLPGTPGREGYTRRHAYPRIAVRFSVPDTPSDSRRTIVSIDASPSPTKKGEFF
jgi:hypothetical protein